MHYGRKKKLQRLWGVTIVKDIENQEGHYITVPEGRYNNEILEMDFVLVQGKTKLNFISLKAIEDMGGNYLNFRNKLKSIYGISNGVCFTETAIQKLDGWAKNNWDSYEMAYQAA